VIAGEGGSGYIAMNGAAAHLIKASEQIIIMGFELTGGTHLTEDYPCRRTQSLPALLVRMRQLQV